MLPHAAVQKCVLYAWVDRYLPYLTRHGSAAGNRFSPDFSGQERSARRRVEEGPGHPGAQYGYPGTHKRDVHPGAHCDERVYAGECAHAPTHL